MYIVIAVVAVLYVMVALVVARICGMNTRMDEAIDRIEMPSGKIVPEDKHLASRGLA